MVSMQLASDSMCLPPSSFYNFIDLLQDLNELLVTKVVSCNAPTPNLEILKDGALSLVGLDDGVG